MIAVIEAGVIDDERDSFPDHVLRRPIRRCYPEPRAGYRAVKAARSRAFLTRSSDSRKFLVEAADSEEPPYAGLAETVFELRSKVECAHAGHKKIRNLSEGLREHPAAHPYLFEFPR